MARGLRVQPGQSERNDPRAVEYFYASLTEQLGPDMVASRTLDVGSVSAGGKQTFTVAVPGARADRQQTVVVGVPSTVSQDLFPWGFVSADEEVTVVLRNPTGAPIDPASATYTVRVFP
jgi:hypothetical protein